ncbi:MAG: peptidylprolyl isomerase [Rubrivivax sp.]|nr:peptidylprolyl isomerase [Rubrivivax sp.]
MIEAPDLAVPLPQAEACLRTPRRHQRPGAWRPVLASMAMALAGGLLLADAAWAQARPSTSERATARAADRAADRAASRPGDHIVAVVNQELVTAVEIELRLRRAVDEAARSGQRLPPAEQLRQRITDDLIEERVILTYARESGAKIDEPDLNRAVQAVAAQNQLTVDQLRERLKQDGIDYTRFRNNLQEQLLVERTREREVYPRIRVTDAEVERVLEQQRSAAQADATLNLAQILVTIPEGASAAVIAERRARADAALARVRAGTPFETVAREVSEDANRERGGEIGARPASRLPDLFVAAAKSMQVGEVSAAPVQSAAGFHVLKLLSRDDGSGLKVTQTRARHILVKPTEQLKTDQVQALLNEYRRRILSGQRSFEDMARSFSEDGSAQQGGDLGWAVPGMFVPEFEEAMSRLPLDGISEPVVSRFGVHLIQVLERRQVDVDPRQAREQARNTLREQKFEGTYNDWVKELRGRAYVEMREPPQ